MIMLDLTMVRNWLFESDPSKVDAVLLGKVLEHITEHPETWRQDVWATWDESKRVDCGTAFCLAGHLVIAAGEKIDWTSPLAHEIEPGVIHSAFTAAGEYIEDVAARLLGISVDDADELFAGSNTLGELWTYAHVLTDGAIEIPEQFTDEFNELVEQSYWRS